MRIRTAVIATLLLAATLTACGGEPKPDLAACTAAVEALAEGGQSKPSACNGVSEDDYLAIVVNVRARAIGLLDDDGEPNPDISKLEDLLDEG